MPERSAPTPDDANARRSVVAAELSGWILRVLLLLAGAAVVTSREALAL